MNQTSSASAPMKPGSVEQALENGVQLLGPHPELALRQAETLLSSRPDARAFRLAAAALRRLDRVQEAQSAEMAGIQAGLKDKSLEAAAIAQTEGRSTDAQAVLEQYLRVQPDDLLARTMLAETDLSHRQYERAETLLRDVLDRAPQFLRASVLLAKCLSVQAQPRAAIAVLDGVLARKPQNRTVLEQLAQLRSEVGDFEEALSLDQRLLALDESQAEFWVRHAHHLRIVGRSSESRAALRRALTLDSTHGAAWWALANFYPEEISAEDEQVMREAVARKKDNPQVAGPLHIALSILADRRREYGLAFEHLAAGKALRKEMQDYDPKVLSEEVSHAVELLTPDLFAQRREWGLNDSSPIFVIGLPRSGTTLVERILGRHSAIEPAGELPLMRRLMEMLGPRARQAGGYGALFAAMPPEELTALGQWYVDRSADYRHTEKPHFVDKLNLNWLYLGFIRLILPNARVIDVRRSALDCCWSNFRLLFSEGHPPSNDLRHIGRFYRDYVRMVGSIDAAAPGGLLPVRYEDVVDDIEGQTRRMLDFIGLPYEPACIDFSKATGAVATPSSEQVRRPLNREGIGAAEPYRPWLRPLIEELGSFA